MKYLKSEADVEQLLNISPFLKQVLEYKSQFVSTSTINVSVTFQSQGHFQVSLQNKLAVILYQYEEVGYQLSHRFITTKDKLLKKNCH